MCVGMCVCAIYTHIDGTQVQLIPSQCPKEIAHKDVTRECHQHNALALC